MDNPDFIDRLLAEKEDAGGDDVLQAIAEEIYSDTSKWEKIGQYPQYIQDVFYIIDYDTTLQMEGLEGFFEAGENYAETYQALMNCGARSEAEILKKASAISFDQEDYNEQYLILEKQTAYENDYEGFWKLVTDYIEKNIS